MHSNGIDFQLMTPDEKERLKSKIMLLLKIPNIDAYHQKDVYK